VSAASVLPSKMTNYECPRCGHELRDFQSSGFCEGCGQRLVVGEDGTKSKRGLSITVLEVIAFAFAFIAKANGANVIATFFVFMVVSFVGFGLIVLWQRAVKPTGVRLREAGLVGIGHDMGDKVAEVMKPILYGKQGKLADEIRSHIITNHVNPARSRKQGELSLRAGDIHRELSLKNRMPAVCGVLGGEKLQQEAHIMRIATSGPIPSATAEFRFKIL
jgi:DNA-directed RNA polymerase subunit RPC12/RpoP